MKTYTKTMLAVLALSAAALTINAQDERPNRPGGPGGQGGGPGGMRNPIVAALDANGDGEIDATELNNAVAALKKLDKNGDGKLTREELRPAGGPRGEGRGPEGERPRRREGAQGDDKKQ